ncbi:MAG TPA: DNA polymerase III subunit delta' [Propioniciclava sp.]|jgi:DNA polymerase-3 subunit delta'|uniref:DNA polymerase III subunit delta' n=1 Tax=Propioniciclava sp. TaxID=2038686 RepID=UPI002C2B99AE|nr:DNA polymerase III subunit delta' [Propioniciclava sp.]HRL48843.1 DNA polymerase III subunit delta' [Propioniciclava sp.]HRL79514.1 DNA polymerase III subunit delta' [Propioniciclava sp.]
MSESPPAGSGVWADLVGQERAVEVLRRAVMGEKNSMTHAWLLTGPPGSGRSNAARAFAAALQCERGGCGACNPCRTSLSGAHPDVTLLRTEQLSIGVDEVRDLVRRAAMSPTLGRHQVIVVEDADRVTERGADALLKAVEEPAPRTVWVLCAPTPQDVVITIRSRARNVSLTTPSEAAITALLIERDGVPSEMAAHAARVAQGHIGRAKAIARSEDARRRRAEILRIPTQLITLGACLQAATNVVEAATAEAAEATADLDVAERTALSEALGVGTKGAKPRHSQAALRDLEDQQKARAKRIQRDSLDRVLSELTSYYRDVFALQTGATARLVNADMQPDLAQLARRTNPERTVTSLDAILAAREALETNVAPQLAMEALMIGLHA